MALTVQDIDALQEYFRGVMDRAHHHAGNVYLIALALVGAIVWCKDDLPIKVMAREGVAKNVLWVHIGGEWFAFTYSHASEMIEMRKGSIKGDVYMRFDNNTSLEELHDAFTNIVAVGV